MNTKNSEKSYVLFLVVYILMILTGFILPFFSDPDYLISENTLSELGAQNTPNNWIMNFVFILLGFITFINGFKVVGKHRVQIFALFIFCLSFVLTGIFMHAPIDRGVVYDSFQNEMHSVFSTITGISFCTYCLVVSFIIRWRYQKIMAISVGIIALIVSYLMIVHSDYRGLYQRGIFIMAFGWILYSFKFYEYVFTKKEYFQLINRNGK
ncbi:DUF998 domain-containing protein [Aquimarina sp. BL5]|uniref:DUF998 domain-containing protein n=1 Tax=Aquimarina sp. BL5 TaxID=1714860 RepID=UPI000E4B55CF|nr:DUF998 domain-containing protein [Aquimarina sp. BL5]AXT51068.1 DUF998 domain-containing protein [Aquimarina sp. BL5]RKN02849.1 DUF998 domain-containing protein [Aquimarina sp. BL5]